MSKRFGRNQKRRLNERIDSLEGQLEIQRDSMYGAYAKLHAYEEWEARLNRVVPQYSALKRIAPSTRVDTNSGDYDQTETFVERQWPAISPLDDHSKSTPFERIQMNIMRVESQPDEFNRALRLKLVFNDDVVAYSLSDDVLKMNDFNDEMINWTAHDIANKMYEHIKTR